jgi:hypothetical protein
MFESRKMKNLLYLMLGLAVGLISGYAISKTVQPSVRPKMQQYLKLTFGTSDPAAVSDKDAQFMIDFTHDYANEQAHDQTVFWQTLAICKLKELSSTGTPQKANDYVDSTVSNFLEIYRTTNYIPGFAKFASKLYDDLNSDKTKIDTSTFELGVRR